ncbi:MAG: hypothetical protein SLAVMIC_00628 [uncultured marine phage]|uniref:Uncharacterized protein n=1 Tax=uncultured marine phage TaxID=707152 RepID=A0A8D9FR91_9VIRU|nr:MAG: hypothetical protein SLAVMIC_00628 [uncultured marine phage]
MAIKILTSPTLSTVQVKERQISNLDENYSSPLVNFIEKSRIDGVDYTKFYTEVDTNLTVGDRVYIVNGNYDTYDIIEINPYRKGTNGYVILEIDRCAITLDLEYTGVFPWDSDDFDNYIKIYASNDDQRTSYEVLQNGYYPYKYTYGFRANNNILFSVSDDAFFVADPYNSIEDFANWTDVTTGIMSNSMPTLSGNTFTDNNDKMLIMDSFTYNGTEFKEGYVYKFEEGSWVIDNYSRRAYLSKANFRDGRFAGGNWNDGVFGQIEKKIDWTGATWNNGVFFNSNWLDGVMGSKSDSITRQSYYAFLEDGNIKQTTDFNNNSGFGYNFIYDSSFEKITVNNANATNCVFGSYSATQSVIKRYLIEDTFDFDINLKDGRYIDSLIEDALISDGLYEFSDIENSNSIDGRFVDTNIDYSVAAGEYEGIGSIEILGYDRLISSGEFIYDNPYLGTTSSYVGTTASLVVNHKFYITEENYLNIKAGTWINLNRLVTSNPNFLNFLDNSFYMGSDKNGELYIADNYGVRSKVLVQLNSKEQNEKLRTIPASDEFPNFVETTQINPRPSVDLYVHFDGDNNGETLYTLSQPFNDGADLISGSWSLDLGTAPVSSTFSSGGFFTASNSSLLLSGGTLTSASYSVEVSDGFNGGASYSIYSPSGLVGATYLEYYWCSYVFMFNPTHPTIEIEGYTSSTWVSVDLITATDSVSGPGTLGTDWFVRSINLNDGYEQLKLTVTFPSFAGPNSRVKIDDIAIDGSLFFESTNVALDDWRTDTTVDINYRQIVTNVEDASLQIANIEKTIFNGGVWKASKVNNVDYRIARPAGIISGTYGEYLSMTFSGGYLEVTLDDFSNILYPGQLELDDVVAIDNISYDLGGTISQVDGVYLLATYSEAPLTLTLEDLGTQSIAGSYSSGGNFISTFIVEGGSTYSISDIQPIFNSIHLEKIQDTTINQGFLKREFFESNTIDNENFEIQTELDIRNVNKLKITEMLLDSSNDLTVRSGLFIRNFIKDTEWENGIIFRSMLKDMNILDGVVLQSKWKSGTFSGGIFLDARKETISDPDDLAFQFATQLVLSEWDDGEFVGGEFFDGIWDNGNFRGGKFYNSIFAAGYWHDGEFGDLRYNNADSKFGQATYTHESVNILGHPIPTWYDGVFTNGEFGLRNREFTGSGTAAVPYPPIGTMSWYDGTFNDGTIVSYGSGMEFGHPLEDQGGVIWHDGTFNNGDIIGIVRWKDGTFNQGKFRSAYGSGLGTFSNNYAWEGGIFNGGRFGESGGVISVSINATVNPIKSSPFFFGGNPLLEYENPSWFDGRFNDGFFYGKYWNDGVFTGGRFIGSTAAPTSKFDIETWPSSIGTVSSTSNAIISGGMGDWVAEQNTTFDNTDHIIGTLQLQQTSSITGESFGFSWGSTDPYSIALGPTVSGSYFAGFGGGDTALTSPLVSPPIEKEVTSVEVSWQGSVRLEGYVFNWNSLSINASGIDEDGATFSIDLVDPPGTVYGNISAPSGTPTDYVVSGLTKKVVPTGVDYIPSNAKFTINFPLRIVSATIGAELVKEYTQLKMDDIRFNYRFEKTATIPDQFVQAYAELPGFAVEQTPFFGMWRDGLVISDNTVSVGKSNFLKLSKLESVRRFKGETSPKIFFENVLWVDGEFNAFGEMDNCVWLNGSFKNGKFLNSAFNPYVPRWDFHTLVTTSVGKYSYELSDSCVWKSGYLDNSEFSISEWKAGTFNNGDMIGGHFMGGVANYINAYNCVWDGGRWRNGNWYGADFERKEIFRGSTSGAGTFFLTDVSRSMDILTTTSKRLGAVGASGSNELFLWNAFDGLGGLDPYISNDTYQYFDGGATAPSPLTGVGTMSSNDFVYMGSMSETTTISDGPFVGLITNRSLGLNYFNISSGYDTGVQLYWNLAQNPLVDQLVDGDANVTSRWGNGAFLSGRWENGVWNNGVRIDGSFDTESVNALMDDVSNFFQVSPDRWQIELSGQESIDNLDLGDYIAIGNIVGLDVNGNRKFLKDSYQIIAIDKVAFTLSVIIKTSFPLRSIERDSENHKVYVTKNVWENGKFHNGKFDGVWNSGRFEGYPRITEMENTYWIDGTFIGGKFSAEQLVDSFGVTYSTGLIQNATINTNTNMEDDKAYRSWMDLNFDVGMLDSRSTTITETGYLSLPSETTKDVLSANTKIWIGPPLSSGLQTSTNRTERFLKLGDKFKTYDQIITNDLTGLGPGNALSTYGWHFSTVYANGAPYELFSSYLPGGTQRKFLGYEFLTGDVADAMVIDLSLPPTSEVDYDPGYLTANGTFSWTEDLKYNISNDDLLGLERYRYWEASFTLAQHTKGDVSQYPGLGSAPALVEGQTWKSYYWDFPQSDPFTSVATHSQALISVVGATGVEARINDIKFTEVDSIPFYDYWTHINHIDKFIKVPLESTSLVIFQSETDAVFIDNKSNTNTK